MSAVADIARPSAIAVVDVPRQDGRGGDYENSEDREPGDSVPESAHQGSAFRLSQMSGVQETGFRLARSVYTNPSFWVVKFTKFGNTVVSELSGTPNQEAMVAAY